MKNIKVLSFYLARLFIAVVVFMPIYTIFQWLFIDSSYILLPDVSPIHTPHGVIYSHDIAWTLSSRFIACCAQLIGIFPFLMILYYLAQICRQYEIGQIFTLHNAQSYYVIGKLLFFDALLAQPISGGLWVLATTLSNPVGERCIRITIGTPNVMALLMGLLVVFISCVMIEGSKIEDEQQLTV